MTQDQFNRIFKLKSSNASIDYLVYKLNREELVLTFNEYLKFNKLNANHNSYRSWDRFVNNLELYLGFLVLPEIYQTELQIRVDFDPKIKYLIYLLNGKSIPYNKNNHLCNSKSVLPILETLLGLNKHKVEKLWTQIKTNSKISKNYVEHVNRRFNVKHTEESLRSCILNLLSY